MTTVGLAWRSCALVSRVAVSLAVTTIGCKNAPSTKSSEQQAAALDGPKAENNSAKPESIDGLDAQNQPDDDPAAQTAEAGKVSKAESAHRVVFSDRISHGYALLLSDPKNLGSLSRDGLAELVEKGLRKRGHSEADLARLLITKDPEQQMGNELRGTEEQRRALIKRFGSDLLGFHFELLSMTSDGGLIPAEFLRDQVLTRELSIKEKESVPLLQHVLLLKADYRHQHDIRGFRLLQAITHHLAEEYGALIFDVDTNETVGPAAFHRRRFIPSRGNVADQVSVIPMVDSQVHNGGGASFVRLSTLGMRRFGSPDLELDGLPRDPAFLQRATLFLHATARVMAQLGELGDAGYAVEVDERLKVSYGDAVAAYSARDAKLIRCESCPGHIDLHLVERPAKDQDAQGHVVARLVASRPHSDVSSYNHPMWVRRAVNATLGSGSEKSD